MSGNEPTEDFEQHRRPPETPPEERPDWLVGAEEGAQSEAERDVPAPVLRLVRPAGASDSPAAGKPKPEAWKAAASSVPRLRHVEKEDDDQPIVTHRAPHAARPEPEPVRPDLRLHIAGDDEERMDDLTADPLDPAPARTARAAPVRHVPVFEEPWWAVALDTVRTSRPIQLGGLAAVLAFAAYVMWPRSEPTVSIGTIREHPERFSGATVRVQGKVGDIYDVGGAHAYYLVQGRDTIVVFTRVGSPLRNERVRVSGSVSMGYLDGVARPALFEIAQ
jgi:hypothetical protein